jgi:hypothetical protein
MILVTTNHPYLRVRCHSLYQSNYGCNTTRATIFVKTMVKKRLDAIIRTIVVLTGGKLTSFYFPHLFYVI